MRNTQTKRSYWIATRRLTLLVLMLWCLVSFGAGILGAGWLNRFSLGGYPLGFWFAQQGSIVLFVVLVFFYARRMDRIDLEHQVDEQ